MFKDGYPALGGPSCGLVWSRHEVQGLVFYPRVLFYPRVHLGWGRLRASPPLVWDAYEGTTGLIPCHHHHPSLVSIPCIFINNYGTLVIPQKDKKNNYIIHLVSLLFAGGMAVGERQCPGPTRNPTRMEWKECTAGRHGPEPAEIS